MLHREHSEGIIAISQPAHAWISGELARHWGNKRFGQVTPAAELCQAAALHDIGFVDWERLPTLNPATGLPHTFLDMPTRLHLELWSKGIRQMMRYGRYAALLVSMHFSHLCRKHRSEGAPDRESEEVFLRDQEGFQRTLLTSLRNDFFYSAFCDDEQISRNRQLISYWDWLSLMICIGFEDRRLVSDAPAAAGTLDLQLTAKKGNRGRIVISPWPFREESLRLNIEGRHLLRNFSKQAEMRRAYRKASVVTIEIELAKNEM